MEQPFFSIIIPTYNAGKTLSACLESLSNQSFKKFEIIIVDGISSDDTMTIINRYAGLYQNIHWVSNKDTGVYDAMNRGIDMARGEWLYFLGANDKLFNNRVLNKLFDESINDKINLVYGNVRMVGDSEWAKDGDLYDGEFSLKKLFNKNISHQSIFYRRSFVKNIGYFNTRYPVCADWDFNLRCRAKSSFKYVNDIIADFSGGGLSEKKKADQIFGDEFLPNLLKYFNLSVFDPLISNPEFLFYSEVRKLQQQAGRGTKFFYKCKRKLQSIIHL